MMLYYWCIEGVLWLRPFLMNSVFVVRALPLVDGSLFLCLLFLFMPGGRPFRSLIYIYIYDLLVWPPDAVVAHSTKSAASCK